MPPRGTGLSHPASRLSPRSVHVDAGVGRPAIGGRVVFPGLGGPALFTLCQSWTLGWSHLWDCESCCCEKAPNTAQSLLETRQPHLLLPFSPVRTADSGLGCSMHFRPSGPVLGAQPFLSSDREPASKLPSGRPPTFVLRCVCPRPPTGPGCQVLSPLTGRQEAGDTAGELGMRGGRVPP